MAALIQFHGGGRCLTGAESDGENDKSKRSGSRESFVGFKKL
ncbi:unnamed protein product, partial [marine sediment metagenome]